MNWSEGIRRFLEQRVREIEQLKAVEELEELVKELPPVSRGMASGYVRKDRDSS